MSPLARSFVFTFTLSFAIVLTAQNATFQKKVVDVKDGTTNITTDQTTALGDLNGDGIADFAFVVYTSDAEGAPAQLSVLLSNGPASYDAQPATYSVPAASVMFDRFLSTRIADFNHDGHLDVLVQAHDTVLVYLGNGDGTLRSPSTFTTAHDANGAYGKLQDVSDFNNDGNPDLVTALDGTASMYLGKGDGTFAAPIQGPHVDGDFFFFYAGDFDGDGNMDLLARGDSCGESACAMFLHFFWGDGTAAFPTATDDPTNYHNGFVQQVVDLNKDGRADVLGGAQDINTSNNYFFVLYGNAARNPQQQNISYLGAPGDFDNDGDLDLALGGYRISYRNADGSYSAPVTFGSGNSSQGPIVADFNNDGKADILYAVNDQPLPYSTSSLEIFLNSSSGSSCATPTSVGITVCDPQDGSTVTSPVRLRASAKLSTSVYRFEVWANGTKIYTGRETGTIDAQVAMEPGSYTITFVARSSSGERVEKTIDVTVQSSSNVCEPPTENGIVICDPAANATVVNPFEVKALAKTGNTYRFELWDQEGDGKLASVANSGYMDVMISLPSGPHTLVFVARRLDGYRVTATRDIVVK